MTVQIKIMSDCLMASTITSMAFKILIKHNKNISQYVS